MLSPTKGRLPLKQSRHRTENVGEPPNQHDKGAVFRALHQRDGAFIIPNPWDVGSARILARLGFEALASTSAGFAFSMGLPDGRVGRDPSMAHVASIASATDLPVSADLENGFGDDAETVAETIRMAGAVGLAGGSIEDLSSRTGGALYEIEHAAERIRAAADAARALPHPFTLTARAENYLVGRSDLRDTITRLQAYQEAGADVLYAPGLTSREDIAAVVRSVDRPVNVVMGLQGVQLDLESLSALGVKRVSVGSALSRAALGAFLRAAHEMRERGSFTFANDAAKFGEISRILE
jgi:2-methylisocitrate lyase-like PEP mutase family enzyme